MPYMCPYKMKTHKRQSDKTTWDKIQKTQPKIWKKKNINSIFALIFSIFLWIFWPTKVACVMCTIILTVEAVHDILFIAKLFLYFVQNRFFTWNNRTINRNWNYLRIGKWDDKFGNLQKRKREIRKTFDT